MGFFDKVGGFLKGAGIGFLTGGVPGAVVGGLGSLGGGGDGGGTIPAPTGASADPTADAFRTKRYGSLDTALDLKIPSPTAKELTPESTPTPMSVPDYKAPVLDRAGTPQTLAAKPIERIAAGNYDYTRDPNQNYQAYVDRNNKALSDSLGLESTNANRTALNNAANRGLQDYGGTDQTLAELRQRYDLLGNQGRNDILNQAEAFRREDVAANEAIKNLANENRLRTGVANQGASSTESTLGLQAGSENVTNLLKQLALNNDAATQGLQNNISLTQATNTATGQNNTQNRQAELDRINAILKDYELRYGANSDQVQNLLKSLGMAGGEVNQARSSASTFATNANSQAQDQAKTDAEAQGAIIDALNKRYGGGIFGTGGMFGSGGNGGAGISQLPGLDFGSMFP